MGFSREFAVQDAYTRGPVRHHQLEKIVQRVVQAAVHKARISQPASCHTFRHVLQPICLRPAATFVPWRSFLSGPVQRAQIHRFRDIDNADIRRRSQIRAGARQSQHAVISPRR